MTIETETTWQDSGFDCDHCGGEILERTDSETGRPDRTCYQCRACGCQWSLDGRVLRIGDGPHCKAAAREREGAAAFDLGRLAEWANKISRHLWILLAIIAGAVLLRFGGGIVLRYLLPVILLAVGAYLLLRYGQKQKWW
jgi:predicted RNA-binding Zn-ribbon protein involved in translation (DUF1610 family)